MTLLNATKKVLRSHAAPKAVLAVCSTDEAAKINVLTHSGAAASHVPFGAITDELLQTLSPRAVISPLFEKDFDCIELASLLHSYDFKGEYRAVAANVPNPGLIEAEIRQAFPSLDFKVVSSD